MSSDYRILCLSHDPAIVTDAEWHSSAGGREAAERAAAAPVECDILREHVGCDLLIGRYSYPLVEIGCPVGAAGPHHIGYHPHAAQWVDAGWLRLLCAVTLADSTPGIAAVLRGSVTHCWTAERARRLRYQLGAVDLPDDEAGSPVPPRGV